MTTTAVPMTTGKAIDFGAAGRPLAWYQEAAKQATVVVLDMMTPGWLAGYHNALTAGQGVMLFQGFYAPFFAVPAEGQLRGRAMVTAAQDAELAAGTTVWLDVESVPATVTAEAMAAWINAWGKEVKSAGFRPGLYVGPGQPLNGQQLYELLTDIAIYWRSLSAVPEVATRGYAMVQVQGNAMLNGEVVDWDTIGADNLGGTVYVCRQDPASTAAPASGTATAPSSASDVAQLTAIQQQLTTLTAAVQENSQQIANWNSTKTSIAKLLQ